MMSKLYISNDIGEIIAEKYNNISKPKYTGVIKAPNF